MLMPCKMHEFRTTSTGWSYLCSAPPILAASFLMQSLYRPQLRFQEPRKIFLILCLTGRVWPLNGRLFFILRVHKVYKQ